MKNQSYRYDPRSAAASTDSGLTPASSGGITPATPAPVGTGWGTIGTSTPVTTGGFGSSTSVTGLIGGTTGGFISGGSFDSASDFPDWLKEPDTSALQNEYANIDQYFNIGNKIKPIRREANAQFSNALQQGAGAADEAITRAFQTGIVGPINTSIISAQTAMPALLAKLGAEKDIAGLRIQNMYKEQQARAQLAAQIADMRQNYVNTMAQYALGQDKLSLDSALGFGQLGLQRDQFNFAQRQYQDRKDATEGPSYGELASIMTAANADSAPQATNFWQQFGAGLGGYADRPARIGFGGASSPGTGGPLAAADPWADIFGVTA